MDESWMNYGIHPLGSTTEDELNKTTRVKIKTTMAMILGAPAMTMSASLPKLASTTRQFGLASITVICAASRFREKFK